MSLEDGNLEDIEALFQLIQDVAEENEYWFHWDEDRKQTLLISLYRDIYKEQHCISPYTYDGNKWIKVAVHTAENAEDEITLYSLRNKSDVVRYCQLLISMADIKVRRRR